MGSSRGFDKGKHRAPAQKIFRVGPGWRSEAWGDVSVRVRPGSVDLTRNPVFSWCLIQKKHQMVEKFAIFDCHPGRIRVI